MKYQILFSGNITKNITNWSSSELAQWVVKAKLPRAKEDLKSLFKQEFVRSLRIHAFLAIEIQKHKIPANVLLVKWDGTN